MASAKPREKGRSGWCVRWRDPDGRYRRYNVATRAAAKALEPLAQAAEDLGQFWDPRRLVEVQSLASLITKYLDDLCRTEAQNTINSHRSQLEQWLIFMGRKTATGMDISRARIEEYDGHRASSGKAVSTRRLGLQVIGVFWRWCAEHETWRAHVPPVARVRAPKRETHDVVAPLWAEVDAVVVEARKRADERGGIWQTMYLIALLLRATGLRVSQVLALRWSDIDIVRGTIRIRPELGKTPHERRGRTLPPSLWLIPELLRRRLPGDLICSTVAKWRKGIEPGTRVAIGPSRAAEMMSELWRSVRIDGEPVRPDVYVRRPDHAFRKAIRTELTAARCAHGAIEYWCGRSTGTGGDVYTDPRAHDLIEIADAIPAPPGVPGVSRTLRAVASEPRVKRSTGASR
jgi:integrase